MSTGLLVGGRRAWRSPAVTHRRQWDSGSFCPGRSRSSASQSHRRGRSSGAPLLCWPESGMFARTAAAARTAMQALRSHVSLSDQPDVAISPPGGPQSGRTRPTQRATPACDAHCRTCSRVRLARDSLEQRGEGELRSHPHPVVLNCCFLRGDRQAHASCPCCTGIATDILCGPDDIRRYFGCGLRTAGSCCACPGELEASDRAKESVIEHGTGLKAVAARSKQADLNPSCPMSVPGHGNPGESCVLWQFGPLFPITSLEQLMN